VRLGHGAEACRDVQLFGRRFQKRRQIRPVHTTARLLAVARRRIERDLARLRASILRNDRAGAFEHDSILLTDHRRMLAKIGRAVRAQTPDASGSDRYGEADRFTVLIEQRDRDVRRLVGDIRKDD